MSNPFVAEIRIFPFNFAPKGWAFCAGQLMPISQNTALFSLLGTYYGGDGKSNFGLPNLQGNVAIHTTQYSGGGPFGTFDLGQESGSDYVTLVTTEMPAHSHTVQADANHANANSSSPSAATQVNANPTLTFSNSTTPQLGSMNPAAVSVAGGSAPHNNLMPYLTLSYCIALQGVYPARP
ncbi:MAG: phage Tail Collar domain protein [Candidatus Eremiobacteraeota bacterium]|nr:phage Tail Collar domain protein [Candidatus Eremiobacteraeota bacterium]